MVMQNNHTESIVWWRKNIMILKLELKNLRTDLWETNFYVLIIHSTMARLHTQAAWTKMKWRFNEEKIIHKIIQRLLHESSSITRKCYVFILSSHHRLISSAVVLHLIMNNKAEVFLSGLYLLGNTPTRREITISTILCFLSALPRKKSCKAHIFHGWFHLSPHISHLPSTGNG
jgi:hypothetical protein